VVDTVHRVSTTSGCRARTAAWVDRRGDKTHITEQAGARNTTCRQAPRVPVQPRGRRTDTAPHRQQSDATVKPGGHRRPRPRDRREGIRPARPGRPRNHRINLDPDQDRGEERPDHLDPSGESAQPPPHRLRGPTQPSGDRTMSRACGTGGQRRPGHLDRVCSPEEARHRAAAHAWPRIPSISPAAGRPSAVRCHHTPTGPGHAPSPPAGLRIRGQLSFPSLRCRSTSRTSTSTPTMGASVHPRMALPTPPSVDTGGPLLVQEIVTVTVPTRNINPSARPTRRRHPQRRQNITSSASLTAADKRSGHR
jgi:hypothetical protein